MNIYYLTTLNNFFIYLNLNNSHKKNGNNKNK